MTTTEMPKYRVTREILPAEKDRFRFENPFTEQSNADRWQYGTTTLKAGTTIETAEWPHPSFCALNDVAKRIHDYFAMRQKSRSPRSPYDTAGRLRLDDGLAGPTPKVGMVKVQPMDLTPVRA